MVVEQQRLHFWNPFLACFLEWMFLLVQKFSLGGHLEMVSKL